MTPTSRRQEAGRWKLVTGSRIYFANISQDVTMSRASAAAVAGALAATSGPRLVVVQNWIREFTGTR
jgi:hypothetical protein